MSKNKTSEKPYTDGTIKCALEKIENGELSLRAPAQLYRIPQSTLLERKTNKISVVDSGNTTKLSPFLELTLVHLQMLGDWAFGRRLDQVQSLVETI